MCGIKGRVTEMSKSTYDTLCGGNDTFIVSKEMYTKEEAISLAKVEFKYIKKPYYLAVGNGFVRHRAGVDEDHEPCVGWCIEEKEYKRSCPCWVFHITYDTDELFHEDYEYIEIR